jgi:hypothetical protein
MTGLEPSACNFFLRAYVDNFLSERQPTNSDGRLLTTNGAISGQQPLVDAQRTQRIEGAEFR